MDRGTDGHRDHCLLVSLSVYVSGAHEGNLTKPFCPEGERERESGEAAKAGQERERKGGGGKGKGRKI